MPKVLLIQGAGMELMGELPSQELYGAIDAVGLNREISSYAQRQHLTTVIRYTTQEKEAADWVQTAKDDGFDAIVFNPGYFLDEGAIFREALLNLELPSVEVHMTNIHRRGYKSPFSDVCTGRVLGFKSSTYNAAFVALAGLLALGSGE